MSTLEERIKKAKREILDTSNIITFDNLYSFTTENINGYINKFDLKDKSLLTVGSSSDQVLNAHFLGCNDITLIDINEFTKDLYFLLTLESLIAFSTTGHNLSLIAEVSASYLIASVNTSYIP